MSADGIEDVSAFGRSDVGPVQFVRPASVAKRNGSLAKDIARAVADDAHDWRELLDALPIAVYTTDAEGKLTYFNEAAVRLAGRVPKLGSDEWCVTWRLSWPDGTPLPHDQCPMAIALKEDRAVNGMEAVAERPDGTRVPFLPFPVPIHDEAGRLIGAVNTLVDISERKRAELDAKLLQDVSAQLIVEDEPAALYNKLIEAAVALMHSDFASMQILHAERGSGGELELLAFRGFDPRAARFWQWVRADSQCSCGEALRVGRRVVVPNVEACEFMAGSADRQTYLDAGIRAVQSTPLTTRSGRLIGMISTHWKNPYDPPAADLSRFDVLARQAADLIERAQTAGKLRDSEQRRRAVVSQAIAGIAETDLTGRFIEVNDRYCEMLGYSRDELLQLRMQDLTHRGDLPRNLMMFERLVNEGTNFVIEKRYVRKDGALVWVNNSVSAIRDGSGKVVGVAAVSVNMTDRKLFEAALGRETRRFEALNRIAKTLSSDLDLERIVQAATDSATELTGAKFGAFFYNVTDEHGESYMLYTLSGASRTSFEKFGLPRNTAVFEPTFRGTGILRSDDIRSDPRYGKNAPHFGMPKGHLPVVSYLAVPVVSRSGAVLGGLFFAHDKPGIFTQDSEEIAEGIASHAALAIDNARLLEIAKAEIDQRKQAEQRRMALLQEMSHRIKNLLTVANGVIGLSAATANSVEEMTTVVRQRIDALARANDLVRPLVTESGETRHPDTTLDELVRTILRPYSDPNAMQERIVCHGPDLPVSGPAVAGLALVLHELATNAVKYGALSLGGGQIDLAWSVKANDLVLEWRERGGPILEKPAQQEGFGSRLSQMTVRGQFGGSISHEWDPQGLSVWIVFRLDRLAG